MLADRSGRALAILFFAIALTYGVYQTGRAYFHTKQGLDFTPEYVAAKMWLEHPDAPVYDWNAVRATGRRLGLHGPLGPGDPVYEYVYPPWLLPVYAPFTVMPWNVARRVWFVLALAACFGAAALAASAVAPAGASRRAWALGGVAAACLYFPVAYGLMAGQANELPLLMIVLSLCLLRSGRPFLAGLVLAPAGMWKIFTGFPALFLLARREWRALAGLTLGCAAIFLVTLPFTGLHAWNAWLDYIRGPAKAAAAALRNHSIAGNVLLLFSRSPVAPPLLDRPALVRPLTLLFELLAAAVTLLAIAPRTARSEPRYAVQFGATLVLAVLLTPLAWEHYGVFLLPAFFACAAGAALTEKPARGALVVLGASFAVWGLMLQSREDYAALATRTRVIFVPAKCYAALALLGVSAWLSLRRSAPAPVLVPRE